MTFAKKVFELNIIFIILSLFMVSYFDGKIAFIYNKCLF